MGKNTKKYRYFEIGLEWDSWTLQKLLDDAELHQMADVPAKLIGVRLTEYYKLVERGIIPAFTTVSGNTGSLPAIPRTESLEENEESEPPRVNGRRKATRVAKEPPPPPPAPEEEYDILEPSDNSDDSADALLNAFGDEDEDEAGDYWKEMGAG